MTEYRPSTLANHLDFKDAYGTPGAKSNPKRIAVAAYRGSTPGKSVNFFPEARRLPARTIHELTASMLKAALFDASQLNRDLAEFINLSVPCLERSIQIDQNRFVQSRNLTPRHQLLPLSRGVSGIEGFLKLGLEVLDGQKMLPVLHAPFAKKCQRYPSELWRGQQSDLARLTHIHPQIVHRISRFNQLLSRCLSDESDDFFQTL
jgi:hypothetical protein